MAVSAFLSLGSTVKGESTQKGHEGWIELQSWSWTVEGPGAAGRAGGGAAAGKPRAGALAWTHVFDSASIELFRAIWTGRHLATGELHVVRSAEGAAAPVVVVKLIELLVTELATSQTVPEVVEQSVTMTFRTISFEYRQQDAKGGLKPPQTIAWDIRAGTVSPAAAP